MSSGLARYGTAIKWLKTFKNWFALLGYERGVAQELDAFDGNFSLTILRGDVAFTGWLGLSVQVI